ncbi:hypothetical protein [Larkinella sp.]|uniref:hypothetical protein n=1 Tax=Larkinella sp. TaxID=2034517 RepID=UPI003BAC2548
MVKLITGVVEKIASDFNPGKRNREIDDEPFQRFKRSKTVLTVDEPGTSITRPTVLTVG